MDDVISRQLVMKTLCERRCGDKPKGCPSGFCTESLAMDCIPSAKPAQQWIPCSERLPEANERCLCTYEFNEGTCVDFGLYTKRGWFVSGVTAWMPLPEPYKPANKKSRLNDVL